MRIGLLVGDVLWPLAGSAGVSERVHSSVGNFTHSAEALSQPIQRLRAVYSHDNDRGGLKTTLGFSTSRMFDSVGEAFRFDLDYDRLWPRSGILVMEVTEDGGDVSIRHLLNAMVRPPTRRVTGRTVALDYVVTGGEMIFVSDALIPEGVLLSEDDEPLLSEDDEFLTNES